MVTVWKESRHLRKIIVSMKINSKNPSLFIYLFIYLFPFYLTRVALSVSSTVLPMGPVNTDKNTRYKFHKTI